MTGLTTMGVKLDDDIRTRLKTLGKNRDRTPHWLMKTAITEFLEREEELEQRNKETDEALEEYQATGQYVSYEKMDAWLESWGTDREGACPELEN